MTDVHEQAVEAAFWRAREAGELPIARHGAMQLFEAGWFAALETITNLEAAHDAEVRAAAWDECIEAVAWATANGPDPLRYVAEHNPYRQKKFQPKETP